MGEERPFDTHQETYLDSNYISRKTYYRDKQSVDSLLNELVKNQEKFSETIKNQNALSDSKNNTQTEELKRYFDNTLNDKFVSLNNEHVQTVIENSSKREEVLKEQLAKKDKYQFWLITTVLGTIITIVLGIVFTK